MTAPVAESLPRRRDVALPPLGRRSWSRRVAGRRRSLLLSAAAVVAAVWASGIGRDPVLNSGGWPQLRAFFTAASQPETSAAFLRLTWDATVTTVAYAVTGTAVAMGIGLVGGVLLSQTWWRRASGRERVRAGWLVSRGALALPRGVHEAVWGLAFVSVLGLDPLVAVLAVGIPFGAVSAKVVGDLIDESRAGLFAALRTGGASRLGALAYGVLPSVWPDLVSYGFYRLECAIRAAAILGIVGAGGLGFQLALSFQSLRYDEMWTLLFALIVVSGLADLWSGRLRRDPDRRVVRMSLLGAALLLALSLAHLAVDLRTLFAPQARALLGQIAAAAWPPRLDVPVAQLVRLSLETLQMSVLGIAAATVLAVPAAFLAARGSSPVRRVTSPLVRAVLLVARAVPPPVAAFLLLLVMLPGVLPGAAALALYNFGILGRLMAEVAENADPRPAAALRTGGARASHAFAYAVLPDVAPKFAGYAAYRWEVALRETVIVGLVGAGGLGRLLAQQLAAFDYSAIIVTVATLALLALLVDLVSTAARRSLR